MKISFLLLLFCSCVTVFCQTGTIEGRIWDRKRESGLAFGHINIYGSSEFATADKSGRFRIKELPVGTYDVRVSLVGYGDTTLTGVHVGVDSTTVVQVALPGPCEYESHWKDKRCPACGKKNKVVPMVYGLLDLNWDDRKGEPGGCVITDCDPTWYCRTDSLKF